MLSLLTPQIIIIYATYLVYLLLFLIVYKKFTIESIVSKVSSDKISVFLFALVLIIFLSLLYFNSAMSDIPTHARGAMRIIKFERITGHFLFHLLVAIASFFSLNEYILVGAAILILSIAVVLKYRVSCYYINKIIEFSTTHKYYIQIGSLLSLFAFSIILYPVFPKLMDSPVNVWHNPTTIFLMPFALLLFFKSYCFLQGDTDAKTIWILVLLVFLNIIAKPSFFFVFCLVFPLFALIEYKFTKSFWKSLIPVFVGVVFIAAQYFYIYFYLNSNKPTGEESGVIIRLLYYFDSIDKIGYFIVRIIANYAFPLLFLILYFNKIRFNKLLHYSVSLLIVAFLIKFSIFETGPRAGHGNFSWQVVVTGFIWFLISVQLFFKERFFTTLFFI